MSFHPSGRRQWASSRAVSGVTLPLLRVGELAPACDFPAQVLDHPRQVELGFVGFVRVSGQVQLGAASTLLWRGYR